MKNIKSNEFPILASVVLEENNGDISKSAKDIKKIDLMLGIMKSKSLIVHYGRRTRKGTLRKIRGLDEILANIIEREDI